MVEGSSVLNSWAFRLVPVFGGGTSFTLVVANSSWLSAGTGSGAIIAGVCFRFSIGFVFFASCSSADCGGSATALLPSTSKSLLTMESRRVAHSSLDTSLAYVCSNDHDSGDHDDKRDKGGDDGPDNDDD